ncbi:MAG: GerMN domain-containing protein [Acidimicrobiales bacterium]
MLIAISTCALLSACGISTGGAPTRIPANQVPFNLLSPQAPTTTTSTPTSSYTVPFTVYLVASTRQVLVATGRSVAPPGTLTSVLDALLGGPTALESDRNITTALPSSVRLLFATVNGGVATVDFNRAFGQISGTQQVLAVAQVVYTVTGQLGPNIGVQFDITGSPTAVPTGSGAQISGPVHLLEYLKLAPAGTSGSAATGPTSSAGG